MECKFYNRYTLAGLLIGFAGVILLFLEKVKRAFLGGSDYVELKAMFLLMLGSISWTAGSIYSKYKAIAFSNTVNVGWQMFAAGIAFILLSFMRNEPQQLDWHSIFVDAWFSLFYLIFF